MSDRRVALCWASSNRYSRSTAEAHALMATARWCERRRFYPGPGVVVVLGSWRELPAAARTLAVSEAVLGDALYGLVQKVMPRVTDTFARPIAAVAFQVRPLSVGTAPARWGAAA